MPADSLRVVFWSLRLGVLALLAIVTGPAAAESPIVWVPESNTVVRFLNSAIDALNKDDPARAEARARKTLEQQETFGEAHLLLGVALSRQGKVDEALAVLSTLDQRAPGRAPILSEIAMAWFAKEDFAQAGAYAMDAVQRDPDELAGWQALTLVRGRTGEYALLGEELENEEERSGRPAIACFQVHRWVGQGELARAGEALERCEGAESRPFIENAGAALAAAGGSGEERSLRGAAALMSAAVDAFNAGEFSRAERLAGRALDVGATPVRALLIRAEALYWQDKFKEARADIDRMLGDTGSWVTVSSDGSMEGVLTKAAEEDTVRRMRRAASILVVLHAREGDHSAAQRSLADARQALGDIPALRAAEIEALHIAGEDGKAWSALQAALAAGDDPVALAASATKLAYEAAAVASEEAVTQVLQSATPVLLYNLAAGAFNANLYPRCLQVAEALIAPPEAIVAGMPVHRDDLASLQGQPLALGFRCAVAAESTDRAQVLGAQARWVAPLDPDAVWAHAVSLYTAERYEETLAVLDAAGARSVGGKAGTEAWELGISALLGLGRLDEALEASQDPRAPLAARQRTVAALGAAGREGDAASLLAKVCPELPAREKRECESRRAALDRR